ncbi:MAG TPA: lipase family protein [Solirubrobacteraceae bacterium]|nr:lipase family protein [Solirubrobacteraceae bacterium]
MSSFRGMARAALALTAVLALALVSSAAAAPVEGPAGEAFYTPPSKTPTGVAGELVWYRPATINLKVSLPENKAWTVLYQSTAQRGEADFVTGTVIVPSAKWSGKGARPVVTIGIGTQGIASKCAPSKQMITGSEYAGGEIIEALKAGYAVGVTDYQGYTNGAIPTYTAGKAEGQAVLDIVRAARQLPGAGLSESDPTYAWGYSQGGQAVGWAGELQSSYAPNVPLSGIAAGGVPANLAEFGAFSGASVGSGLGIISAIGLQAAYPELKLGTLTPAGEKAVGEALSECVTELLTTLNGASFQEFTTEHKSLEELEKTEPTFKKVLEESSLDKKAVSAPVYHYHGLEDELVPLAQDVNLHYDWCKLGVTDDFQLYNGEHLFTAGMAAPEAIKWIEERVAGKKAPSTCGEHEPGDALPANARLTPEVGDLIVKLNEWSLKGKVTEKKSGISEEVPAGATISSTANATTGALEATLDIPPINQTFWIGLVPVTISGGLTPTGPAKGTFGFSENGSEVFESAEGKANEEVKGIKVGVYPVPIGCKTVEPIDLPLSIREPTNALSTGNFSFKAEVTVPEFGGCGLYGPLISAETSGPGNTVEMTASPPAPINW